MWARVYVLFEWVDGFQFQFVAEEMARFFALLFMFHQKILFFYLLYKKVIQVFLPNWKMLVAPFKTCQMHREQMTMKQYNILVRGLTLICLHLISKSITIYAEESKRG